MPKNVWIDVEELFEFALYNSRPSGIQRMAFEIYTAIQHLEGTGGHIRFVRHDKVHRTFSTVSWSSLAALFNRLAAGAPTTPSAASVRCTSPDRQPESPVRRALRSAANRLPLEVRYRALTMARLQINAAKALADLLAFTARSARHKLSRTRTAAASPDSPDGPGFSETVRPGDIILLLGAPWSTPDYAQMIEAARARHGIAFALLIYDIIPVRRPEWFGRNLAQLFRNWFTAVLPIADHVFTISHATAADIARYIQQSGCSRRASRIQVVPVGTSFDGTAPPVPDAVAVSPDLPAPGTYVLFVSTIEARKNHTLLFRVWRRLLDTLPAAEVPTLVFAGRVGWLVKDLMQQLADTDWLDGKIRLVEAPTDQDVAALYRGCILTLFPSLYEGWGLPVTESLANGKPCLASSSSSMPEAGGKLARYFDPECVTDAYRLIHATLQDKQGLAAWQDEVARDFKPLPWTDTAACILDSLGATTLQQESAA